MTAYFCLFVVPVRLPVAGQFLEKTDFTSP